MSRIGQVKVITQDRLGLVDYAPLHREQITAKPLFYARCRFCGTEYFEQQGECDWCPDVKLKAEPEPEAA